MAKCSLRSTTRTLALQTFKACTSKHAARRTFVTTGSDSNGRISPIASRQEPLTLLHKTSKVLPRVFELRPPAVRADSSLQPEAWEGIFARVYEDLSGAAGRPIRVAVYGMGNSAGSEDFVTALLSNPLDSAESPESLALTDRWKGVSGSRLTLSYGPELRTDRNHIELSSPYLQQFSSPIQLTELRSSSSPKGSLEPNTLHELFQSDIPILLCNPLTSSLETLLSTSLPANTIVIVTTSPSHSVDPDHLLSYAPKYSPKPTILLADPQRAVNAIQLMRSSPTSSLAVQRFQDAFNGSNISSVTKTLDSILRSSSGQDLAIVRLKDALSQCLISLSEIKRLLDAASIDASKLTSQVEELRAKIELEFLGPIETSSHQIHAKPRANEVVQAIGKGEAQMSEFMDRFTWWKMVLRVDEVTSLVSAALHRAWCPELEQKLLFHTGHLSSIQRALTTSAYTLLSTHRILSTSVLRNSLQQLQASHSTALTTTSLTSPIAARRTQIIEYPTARLHVTAQRAVLGMGSGVVGGAGIGWVGWMGWLIGSGEGLLGHIGMEPTTAMGVGALTAVASIRWAVGRWEKAKKKWWADWRRVAEGLDRDLRTTLDRTIQHQVGGVALAASKGLVQQISQRENELAKVQDEVEQIAAEVEQAVREGHPVAR